MSCDPELAERLRALLRAEPDMTEKRMFGGVAFLAAGNMAVSASSQGGLLVRVDPADGAELAAGPHVAPFQMRGRDMVGWLRVDADGVRTEAALQEWVRRGLSYARSLPPKG